MYWNGLRKKREKTPKFKSKGKERIKKATEPYSNTFKTQRRKREGGGYQWKNGLQFFSVSACQLGVHYFGLSCDSVWFSLYVYYWNTIFFFHYILLVTLPLPPSPNPCLYSQNRVLFTAKNSELPLFWLNPSR